MLFELTATDESGEQVSTYFRLEVRRDLTPAPGRQSLSEKLRTSAAFGRFDLGQKSKALTARG